MTLLTTGIIMGIAGTVAMDLRGLDPTDHLEHAAAQSGQCRPPGRQPGPHWFHDDGRQPAVCRMKPRLGGRFITPSVSSMACLSFDRNDWVAAPTFVPLLDLWPRSPLRRAGFCCNRGWGWVGRCPKHSIQPRGVMGLTAHTVFSVGMWMPRRHISNQNDTAKRASDIILGHVRQAAHSTPCPTTCARRRAPRGTRCSPTSKDHISPGSDWKSPRPASWGKNTINVDGPLSRGG